MIPAPAAQEANHIEFSEKGVLNQCCSYYLYYIVIVADFYILLVADIPTTTLQMRRSC